MAQTKYRKRVTEERVDRAAIETKENPATVRSILEADAEVIEAEESCEGFMAYEMNHPSLGAASILTITTPEKQFHKEWELLP